MPVLPITGPPLMVRLSAVRFGAVAMVTSAPLRVTLMFWPSTSCTVFPGLTCVAASPFAWRFQPLLAVPSIAVSASPTLL